MVELQFLNYILDKQDYGIVIKNSIDETYFTNYKDEFNYLEYHYNAFGNTPDKETFIARFKDFSFIEVNETPEFLIKDLTESKLYNKSVKILNDVSDLMVNHKTSEALDLLQLKLPDLVKSSTFKSIDVFEEGHQRYLDYLDKVKNKDKYFMSTGFPELDKITGGIDTKDEYMVIAARPGVGKSYILLFISLMIAKLGYRVGVYSGEMTKQKVGMRIDSMNSHISNFKISRGFMEIDSDYKKATEDLQKIAGKIKLITPELLGSFASVSNFRTFISKECLDILCVDQISLVKDLRRGQGKTEQLINISRDLKQLQTITNIPIIVVSQLNRDIEKGTDPDLSNLFGSDIIGQDATTVLTLQKKDGHLCIQVVKCRDGISGKKLTYHWDVDTGIFNYIPCEDDSLNKKSNGKECEEVRTRYESFDKGEPF